VPRALLPPSPHLTDGRITLRAWSMDDAAAVTAAVQDPEIPRFMGIPPNHTIEGVRRWLGGVPDGFESGTSASFAIVSSASGALLGSVGIERSSDDPQIGEIGYWVAAEARRCGVAGAAVGLLVRWAFITMQLARIEITTHPDNVASLAVARKCGFVAEGVLRSYREHHGERVDLVMCSLLPADLDR